jgi:hypothetical protein
LRGANRGDISRRSGTDNDHIKIFSHDFSLMSLLRTQ